MKRKLMNGLLALCGVVVIGVGSQEAKSQEMTESMGITEDFDLGLEFTDPEVYESIPETEYISGGTLPSSVDLSASFPVPGNQGKQGSCVAWAIGYGYKGYQEQIERGWDPNIVEHQFSPAFLYNQRSIKKGMYITNALDIVCQKGICTMTQMGYSQYDDSAQPSASAIEEAKYFRGTTYSRIEKNNGSLHTKIKSKLYEGYPVIIGTEVYPDFDRISVDNPVFDNTSGKKRGNHCVIITGYDDAKQAYKFINSWGTWWGINGYGYISYDIIQSNVVRELYVLEDAGLKGIFPRKRYLQSNSDGLGGTFARSRWIKDMENYFYFDSSSYMKTTWLLSDSHWYFLNPQKDVGYIGQQGAMCTGWIWDGLQWYYLRTGQDQPAEGGPIGSMCMDWIYENGYWYYLRPERDYPNKGPEGSMCMDWIYENGYWYYLRSKGNYPTKGPKGSMCTGWTVLSDGRYYLRPNLNVPNKGPKGSMVKDAVITIDGKTYGFDKNGRCLNN